MNSLEKQKPETELSQEMITFTEGEKHVIPGMAELIRSSAAEGCVLLKNDDVLPLSNDLNVAVFGRCQKNTFFVGYGSGGDVHPPYRVTYADGLKECSEITLNEELFELYRSWCEKNPPVISTLWGQWPMCYQEMPLNDEIVERAAKQSDVAMVIIGRAAGEERENVLSQGSFYLTETEEQMLAMVTEAFKKTIVVMNCGNIIDMSWTKKYHVQAILYAWLGGMEAGNALADVLCGRVNPCGKLSDTIAATYEDYPSAVNFGGPEYNFYAEDIFVGYRYFETFAKDKVLFPFGFGLSYTSFQIKCEGFSVKQSMSAEYPEEAALEVSVTNIGACDGKETVQLYLAAPQGKLKKAAKSLVAFAKTKLLMPGETQKIHLSVPIEDMVSYDDTGKTGYQFAYVLEEGKYEFFLGNSVENAAKAAGFMQKTTAVVQQLEPVCSIQEEFERFTVSETGEVGCSIGRETVPVNSRSLRERILNRLPEEIKVTGNQGYLFSDVIDGKVSMDSFVAQLNDEELEALTRGEGGMNSSLGTEGNTGVFGGVIPSLREKGVPPMVTADGPAGLRVKRYTSLIPCGTTLSCTWNTELVEKLFEKMGEETKLHKIDVILSPGLNIHRNPLCGRNFEYYSEDPYLSGKTAAAAVRGIQSQGVSACPKHFAGNNQEDKRNQTDDRVSERALREIYLKGFEICVKEGKPQNLMTSYNKVNGVWSHYNYDLVTTVLRGEWGYEGNVMTDWWMRLSASPEFPLLKDNAYRVRAQVDVLMPGNIGHKEREYQSDGSLLATLSKEDGMTRGELQRTAKNVLRFVKWRFKD